MTSLGPSEPAPAGAVPSRSVRRRTTWLFALAAALLGLVQLLALAPWMGEDEPWHLEYSSHVAAGYRPWGGQPMSGATAEKPDDRELMPLSQLQTRRRFHGIPAERIAGTQRAILESMVRHRWFGKVDWAGVESARSNFDQVAPDFSAAQQPPLYYLLAGGVLALAPGDSVEAQLWSARGLSWLLYVAFALVVLGFARDAFDDERLALCCAALAAFLPMSARQAAVVNNDVLAKLVVALVLWISVRWIRGRARSWEVGAAVLLCGVGLLAKSTAASAVLALLAAPLLRMRGVAQRGRAIGFVLALGAVVGAAGYVWITQHNPALPRSLVGLVTRLEAGLSRETFVQIARTLAGSFGWESRALPGPVNAALGVAAGAGVALALARLARGRVVVARPVLVLCLALVVVQLAMCVLRGAARGRYVMPALPALSALVVTGLVASWPEPWRDRAAQAFLLALVGFEALFLWGGLVVNEHLLWGL